MEDIEQLEREMDAAAAALDFETARALRDRITLIRGGAAPHAATTAETAGLERQRPGAMGLGTSQQKITPPPGWKPPPRPNLMTRHRSRRQT